MTMSSDSAFAHHRRRALLSEEELERSIPREKNVSNNGDRERSKAITQARRVRVGLPPQKVGPKSLEDDATDAIVVGALLAVFDEPVSSAALARALRWTANKTQHALEDLKRRLPLTGQILAEFDDGTFEIRPLFEVLDESRSIRTSAIGITDSGLSSLELSLLFRLVHGNERFLVRISEPGALALVEKGLAYEDGSRIRGSNHVRFSVLGDNAPELPFAPAGISVR